MKKLILLSILFTATGSQADVYIDDYPLLGTPATATDYMFVVDSSTAAGGARLLFDGDASKVLSGTGTWIDVALNLGGLSDVTLSSPSTGEVLKYNGSYWTNDTGGASAITDLTGTANRVLYVNSAGDVSEIALGASGTYLGSAGTTSIPAFSTPSGSGDITLVGSCSNSDCFDGASGDQDYLRFHDGNSNYTELLSSDISATTYVYLPDSGGTLALEDRRLDQFGAFLNNTSTTLDATTDHHGLLPYLGGGTTNFLRADGTWADPASSADVTGVGDCAGDDCFDGTSGQGTYLNFYGTGLGNYTQLLGGNPGSNITLTLPTTEGAAGQVLETDGNGVMSWEPRGSGTSYEDISDPETDGSISFGASTGTYTSATDGWDGLIFSNTIATLSSESVLLTAEFNHNSLGDPNAVFFEGISDADGSPVSLFRLDGDGLKVGEGTPTNTMDGNDLFVTDDAEVAGTVSARTYSEIREAGGDPTYQLWYEDPDTGDDYLTVQAEASLTNSTAVFSWPDDKSGAETIAMLSDISGTGDNVSINSSSAIDPDFVSTGDISFTNTPTPDTITANINSDTIVNADINTSAAIAMSKTALTAGDHITLTANDLDVDDDFLFNNGDIADGAYDFGGATFEVPNGPNSSRPGTCDVGDIWFETDATAGQQLFACTASNTWTLMGDGSGSTPSFTDVTAGTNSAALITTGSFEIPNSAAPTINATGEIGFDTDIITQGLGLLYGTSALNYLVATTDTPSDNEIPKYDVSTGTIVWEADSTGTGSLGSDLASTTNDIVTSISTSDIVFESSTGTAEDLVLDLGSTSNIAEFTSTTGVNRFHLTGMDLLVGGDDIIMATNTAGHLLIGDDTNYNPTAVTGDITITGGGVTTIGADSVDASMLSTQYAYSEIPVAWMHEGTGAVLDDASTRSPYVYRTFAHGADNDANFVWMVPADFDSVTTAIQFRVYFLITNATAPTATEGVAFGLSGISLGNSEATNGTKGSVVIVTSDVMGGAPAATQHDIMITEWSGNVTVTGIAAGEVAEMALIRDVSDPVDDYAQDVGVFMVQIRYVQNPGS